MDNMLTDLFGELEEDDDDDDDDTTNDNPVEDAMITDIMDVLLDEIILGVSFEVHRACKLGIFLLDEMDEDSQKQYEIKDIRGLDVFGQVPMKKQFDCVCPNCQRNLAASRFAPHLEKCMGMGRNSSRIASRRIASSGKRDSDNESDGNEDSDWHYTPEKKAKRIRKDKSKKSKASKNKTGDIPSVSSTNSDGSGSMSYDSMSLEERKALLLQTCGVISEHTKKMCTRSVRCPQHTDDQRRAVRLFLLTQQGMVVDDDVIDIDTYDDGDSQSLRDTLHWEAASNPSPDSTSTTNSTSSKKRKQSKHSKNKKKGNHANQSHGNGNHNGNHSHLGQSSTNMYNFD